MIEIVPYGAHNRRIDTRKGTPGAPLVVVLHSAYTTIEKMAALVGVQKFGDWNVILPEALPMGPSQLPRWIDNPRTSPDDQSDVMFLDFAITRALEQTKADPGRIYLVGFSNGSFMVNRLLHEDVGACIAASAMVSGALLHAYTEAPWVAHAHPVLMFNGTSDSNVPYNGMLGMLGVLSVPKSALYWARANGFLTDASMQTLPDKKADGTRVYLQDWSANRKPVVDLYTIDNGGHTWPGSFKNLPSSGRVCYEIDATLVMREWFGKI